MITSELTNGDMVDGRYASKNEGPVGALFRIRQLERPRRHHCGFWNINHFLEAPQPHYLLIPTEERKLLIMH